MQMQTLRPEDRKRRRLAYWLAMGGGGPRGLISNGILSAPLTLARAQAAGVEATGLTSIGWQTYGADTPRFVLPNSGLLIGGQRTNQVRNPRAEGAVAGTPGTLPTNWSTITLDGVSRQVVGAGVDGGLPYLDVRFFGTPTATSSNVNIRFDAVGGIPATVGQIWTSSFFVRLIGGSLANVTVNRQLGEFSSSFVFLSGTSSAIVPTAGSLAQQRWQHTRTLSSASVAFVAETIFFSYTNGQPIDVTLRFGAPQLELGSFASTPILPPIGTPGASTRGGDIVTAPLASLGIGSNGACTVLWRGAFDATNISTQQTIASVSDATDANRYDIQLNTDGVPQFLRVTAGVASTSSFGGSPPTLGSVLRAGMCIDGAGRIAAVMQGYNGGAALNVTGGPTSSLTTLHCGSSTLGDRPLWGTTERLQVLPRVVSDAELAALVAAF